MEEIAKVGDRLCYRSAFCFVLRAGLGAKRASSIVRLEEGTGPAKGWAGISGTPGSARACEIIIAVASA